MGNKLQWAIKRIMEIACPDFYGTITLKFEGGKFVHLDHNHSERPPRDLGDD